jgi:hypothetical protein
MITDLTTLFSNAQSITATAPSTNSIDLGGTGTIYGYAAPVVRDIGKGADIPIRVTVVQSFNNLTNMVITIEDSIDAAFTSPVIVASSPTYVLADLQTGAKLLLPERLPTNTNLRYVRLKYTITGTAPTLGQITAGVTEGNQTNP